MLPLLVALLLSKQTISTANKEIKEGYEVLSIESASGKYTDEKYINAHRIPTSFFTATSTGDRDGYPIENAFDDNSKSFWVSKDPETDSFNPSIFVTFKETVSFECLLFDPIYRTVEPVRYFDGFPRKLRIYTALNDDEPLELAAVFTGNPVIPMTRIQYALPKIIKCKKMQIEFCDLTEATFFETTEALAATEGIILLQVFDHDVVYYERVNGKYENSNFLKIHKIPSSCFTPSSTGDRDGDIVQNAFDGDNDKSWVSKDVETDTFHPSIFVEFHEKTLVDAFLFVVKSHKYLTNRYLDGFPSTMKVYTALNDEEYKLNTVFIGTPSTDNLHLQYVFSKPVECTKIKLEFHDVSLLDNEKLAAVDEITFIKSMNADIVYYGSITGNYANSNFATFHKVDTSKITSSSTGDRDGNPASNAFDNKWETSWISKDAETETFHPSLFAEFSEPILLDAFVLDVTYHTNWVSKKFFDGFPALIALYTSLNDEPLKLNTYFIGSVDTGILNYLYKLTKPVNCTKVQIEFHDVVHYDDMGGYYAATNGITFYSNLGEDTLNVVKVNGDYDNPNYVEYHKVPLSKFTFDANSQQNDNPISNAFDDNTGTYWVSNDVESDTFNPTITVDFKEPVLLEAFLYDVHNHKKLTSWYLDGYPSQIVVYTALNDEPLKLNSIFLGTPGSSDSRSQYVLSKPVNCTKVQLVFYDISEYYRGSRLASTKGITFLQSFVENPVRFEEASGIYTDSYYVNSRTIQTTMFTASSNGDDASHPLSNIFANNNDYWVSNNENSDDFHSTLNFNFPNPVVLEAFLISTTSSNGYPLRLNVYSSLDNEQLTLNAEFANIPTNSWNLIQFVMPTPIKCTKLQIEFVQVTNKKATITQLTLLQELDYDYTSYSEVTGFLSNDHYVETHRIDYSIMNVSSTGERDGYPITNAFDTNDGSIWISSFENTDENHAKIFIDFHKPIDLEALVISARCYYKFPYYYIVGFPHKLKINASTNYGYYSVLFSGSTSTSYTKYQFILPNVVTCTRLELDLFDITQDNEFSGNKRVAIIPGISIIGEEFQDFSQSNFTDDIAAIHVNQSFVNDKISDTEFVNVNLPKDEEYLFYVEKKFRFEDVKFSCIDNKISAIKTEDVPQLIIEKCSFISCSPKNENNFGGAINSINAGINCGKSDFVECKSSRGGGIFIHLDKPTDEKLKIDGCKFTKCSAENGGGCYIYSNLLSNSVTISNCVFSRNSIIKSQGTSTNNELPGSGSGIFMNAMKGAVRKCQFIDNQGECSCTILNNFPKNKQSKKNEKLLNEKDDENLVLVSDCTFTINAKSKSSFFYIGGKYGSNVELRNTVFKGNLDDGARHINGKLMANDAHKLIVKSCMLSHNAQISLNYDPNNSYLTIDLNSQMFNYADSYKKNKVSWKFIVSIVVPVVALAAILVIAIVIIIVKKKQTDNQSDEHEYSTDRYDLLIDQSLL